MKLRSTVVNEEVQRADLSKKKRHRKTRECSGAAAESAVRARSSPAFSSNFMAHSKSQQPYISKIRVVQGAAISAAQADAHSGGAAEWRNVFECEAALARAVKIPIDTLKCHRRTGARARDVTMPVIVKHPREGPKHAYMLKRGTGHDNTLATAEAAVAHVAKTGGAVFIIKAPKEHTLRFPAQSELGPQMPHLAYVRQPDSSQPDCVRTLVRQIGMLSRDMS